MKKLILMILLGSLALNVYAINYLMKMNDKVMLMKFDINRIVEEIENKELEPQYDCVNL